MNSGRDLSRLVVRRLLGLIPLLAAVSLLSFLLLHAAPGSFVDPLRLQSGVTPEMIQRMEEQYGLDVPWYEQYARWFRATLHGDMGMSLRYQRPVRELLSEAVPFSIALILGGYLGAACLGFVLAFACVARLGKRTDRYIHVAGLALASIHPVVVTLFLMLLASVTRWFPVGGTPAMGTLGEGAGWMEFGRYLALPAISLALVLTPGFLLQARGILLARTPSLFVVAARARGITEARILLGNLVPASLGPLLAFAGAELASAFNVALLIEVIVGWPGMGRLAWIGLRDRDGFLLLGAIVVAACALVLGNLLADLLHAKSDPRVRMEHHHV